MTRRGIDRIWVGPPYRRRGYASEAFRRLEQAAVVAGAKYVGLNVHEDNEGARGLYARLGYRTGSLFLEKSLPRPEAP